jgi:hypothetical protein
MGGLSGGVRYSHGMGRLVALLGRGVRAYVDAVRHPDRVVCPDNLTDPCEVCVTEDAALRSW